MEHSDRDFQQIQADFSNRCAQQDIEYVDAHQEFVSIEYEFLTEVSHVVQVRAEGPKAPEAARPERAEAPSPGRALKK